MDIIIEYMFSFACGFFNVKNIDDDNDDDDNGSYFRYLNGVLESGEVYDSPLVKC